MALSVFLPLSLVPSLARLDLSHNGLTGPLPREWGNMTALTSLDLGENLLTGPLPASFAGMRALQRLVLRKNMLSGAVPRPHSPAGRSRAADRPSAQAHCRRSGPR